jgi:hypothetical protein
MDGSVTGFGISAQLLPPIASKGGAPYLSDDLCYYDFLAHCNSNGLVKD